MLVAVFALASSLSWAQGADIYKSRCAMCHGPAGEGGKAGPALKGTKLSEADIAGVLMKGAPGKKMPHTKPVANLTEAQAKQVAAYVKSLK
jgi:mono/diheme cytochrome c family protein